MSFINFLKGKVGQFSEPFSFGQSLDTSPQEEEEKLFVGPRLAEEGDIGFVGPVSPPSQIERGVGQIFAKEDFSDRQRTGPGTTRFGTALSPSEQAEKERQEEVERQKEEDFKRRRTEEFAKIEQDESLIEFQKTQARAKFLYEEGRITDEELKEQGISPSALAPTFLGKTGPEFDFERADLSEKQAVQAKEIQKFLREEELRDFYRGIEKAFTRDTAKALGVSEERMRKESFGHAFSRGGRNGFTVGINDVLTRYLESDEQRIAREIFDETLEKNTLGEIAGQFVGSAPFYTGGAFLTRQLATKIPSLAKMAKTSPFLFGATIENIGQEVIEGTIRKGTGQEYGLGSFFTGLMFGAAGEGIFKGLDMAGVFKSRTGLPEEAIGAKGFQMQGGIPEDTGPGVGKTVDPATGEITDVFRNLDKEDGTRIEKKLADLKEKNPNADADDKFEAIQDVPVINGRGEQSTVGELYEETLEIFGRESRAVGLKGPEGKKTRKQSIDDEARRINEEKNLVRKQAKKEFTSFFGKDPEKTLSKADLKAYNEAIEAKIELTSLAKESEAYRSGQITSKGNAKEIDALKGEVDLAKHELDQIRGAIEDTMDGKFGDRPDILGKAKKFLGYHWEDVAFDKKSSKAKNDAVKEFEDAVHEEQGRLDIATEDKATGDDIMNEITSLLDRNEIHINRAKSKLQTAKENLATGKKLASKVRDTSDRIKKNVKEQEAKDESVIEVSSNVPINTYATGKDVKRTFRIDKFGELNKEQMDNVMRIMEASGVLNDKTMTFKDMEVWADAIGDTFEDLVYRISRNNLTAAETIKLKRGISTLQNKITDLEIEIFKDPSLEMVHRDKLAQLNEKLTDAEVKLKTVQVESGRSVVVNRLIAENNKDPGFWNKKALKEIGEESVAKSTDGDMGKRTKIKGDMRTKFNEKTKAEKEIKRIEKLEDDKKLIKEASKEANIKVKELEEELINLRKFAKDDSKAVKSLEGRLETAKKRAKKAKDRLDKTVANFAKEEPKLKEAKKKRTEIEKAITRLKKDLKKASGGKIDFEVVRTEIKQFLDAGDEIGLAKYIANLRPMTLAEKIATFWKASILSGLSTQFINIGGNVIKGLFNTTAEVTAAGLDEILGIISRKPPNKRLADVLQGAWKGSLKGTIEGGKDVPKIFKEGPTKQSKLSYEFAREIPGPVGVLPKIVFRTMSAADNLFFKAAFEKSLLTDALTKSRKEKISVEEAMNDPELQAKAHLTGLEATYQQDNQVSAWITSMKRTLKDNPRMYSQIMYLASEFIIPFNKTLMNIAADFARNSPVASASTLLRILKGEISREDAILKFTKQAMGTALGFVGYHAYLNGDLNLGWAEDIRDTKELTGEQPISWNTEGGTWNLRVGGPFTMIMIAGGYVAKMVEEEKFSVEEALASVIPLFGRTMLDQSGLAGMAKLISAAASPYGDLKKEGKQILNNVAGGFVPNIINEINRGLIDDTRRNKETPIESMMAKTPGLSQLLDPKQNAFGDIISYDGGYPNAISPMKFQSLNDIKLYNELQELQINVDFLNKLNGQTLTGEERKIYGQVMQVAKKHLKKFIETDEYQSIDSRLDREKVLRPELNDWKREGKERVKQDMVNRLSGKELKEFALKNQNKGSKKAAGDVYDKYVEWGKLNNAGKKEEANAIIETMGEEDFKIFTKIYELLNNL